MDQYKAPVAGLNVTVSDAEGSVATNESGVAVLMALVGEYQIKAVPESVTLAGSVTVENDMYDTLQKFETTLKTAFSIKTGKDYQVAVRDSAGAKICPNTETTDGTFACETADKYAENKFTVEISKDGAKAATFAVEGVRGDDFRYVVDLTTYEYKVNVTAEGLENCIASEIQLRFVNAETEEDILAAPAVMGACSEVVKFVGTAGTSVLVKAKMASGDYVSMEDPTFVTDENEEINVSVKFTGPKKLTVSLVTDFDTEGAEFTVSVYQEEDNKLLETQTSHDFNFSFVLGVAAGTPLKVNVESEAYAAAEEEVEIGEAGEEEVLISLKLMRTLEVAVQGEYEEGDALALIVEDAFGHEVKREKVVGTEISGLELTNFDTLLYYVRVEDWTEPSEGAESARKLRAGAKYLPTRQVLNVNDSKAFENLTFRLVKAANTEIRRISVNFASEDATALAERAAGALVSLQDRDSRVLIEQAIVEAGKPVVFETAVAAYKICFTDPVFGQLTADCVDEPAAPVDPVEPANAAEGDDPNEISVTLTLKKTETPKPLTVQVNVLTLTTDSCLNVNVTLETSAEKIPLDHQEDRCVYALTEDIGAETAKLGRMQQYKVKVESMSFVDTEADVVLDRQTVEKDVDTPSDTRFSKTLIFTDKDGNPAKSVSVET